MKIKRPIVNVLSTFLGSAIIWLFLIQITFYLIQKSQAENFARAIDAEFRQELDYSNFHFLSRSFTDLTRTGAVSCLTLYDITDSKKLILDLKYKSANCGQSDFWLHGSDQNIELKTLNGDTYKLSFRSVNQNVFYFALWTIRLLGISAIALSFALSLMIRRNAEINLSNRIELAETKARLARQVAHDIRSPLSALTAVALHLEDNHPAKNLLQSASARITTIATDLLKSNVNQVESLNRKFSPLIELKKIIDEKRVLHPQLLFVVESKIAEDFQLLLPLDRWQRILSNLLNNSIEASAINSKIHIKIFKRNSSLILEIEDFGSGIPPEILNQLGKEEITTKGELGNGIGLYEAFRQMRAWGSELIIDSNINLGTKVQLIFPQCTLD